MNILVSVIVPVYNVENYIERCIESIINQTYKNIEVILINDGSTDTSPIICEKFSNEDSRLKVVHKDNEGLSSARNSGLNIAEGKYVLFVDSDDYIELNSIEILLKHSIKYDLDVLEANAIKESGEYKEKLVASDFSKGKVTSGIEYMTNKIQYNYLSAAACIKFCNLDFIRRNKLYFKLGRLHEDELWTPQLYLKAKRVKFLDFSFYHYVIRSNSITQSRDMKPNIISILQNCEELEQIYNTQMLKFKHKRILMDYIARQYMAAASLGDYDKEFHENLTSFWFPIRNTRSISTFTKVAVYLVNINWYIKLVKR